jgi:nucleotide-binding universal stress UspA family protein
MASCGDGDGERRIGVAMDYSASSKRALEWAIRNLFRRGDTVVVLHVLHTGGDEAKRAALWAKSGSRKIFRAHPHEQIELTSLPAACWVPN